MSEALQLRSELLNFKRVTLEEWKIAEEVAPPEDLEGAGNQHRIELLDGGHREIPEDCPEGSAGGRYFEDDRRGIEFILEWVEDPTWETLIWASSMHCGGTFEEEALEEVVSEADGAFGGEGQ